VRDLILMAVILASLPLSILRPDIGILVYVWIGLMNPHRFVYQLENAPVALVVAVATILGMVVTRKWGRFPMRSEIGLVLAWFCYTTLTALVALAPDAWAEWDRFGKILLMTIVAAMLLQSKKLLGWFIATMAVSIGFFGVKGGIFSIITRGNYLVWGPANSFIAGNNELALAELMILPLILYFIRQQRAGWKRLLLQGAFALTTVSIVFSYSRGALVALVGLGLILVWRSRYRFRGLAIAAIAGVLLLSFAPKQWGERMQTIQGYQADPSAMGRINAWHFAVNLATHRITGGGFRAFTPKLFYQYAPNPFDYHDAHSIFFEVLGEQGFPGLAIFLGLMGASFFRLQKLRRVAGKQPEFKWVRDLAEMLQCSLVAYALAGAFLGLAYFDLYYYILIAGVLLDVIYRDELLAAGGTAPLRGTA